MAKKTNDNAGYTGYGEASAAELKEILNAAYKSHNVVIIWGLPGVGKTSLINAWSEEMGLGEPIYLIGSSSAPEDVTGLPVKGSACIGEDNVMTTEYGMPWYQAELMSGRRKVLFMDEFSNTSPAVAASLLRIVGDKTFANGMKLPDDAMLIMAANPESSAVDYNPIASPMVNRIVQVSYKPTDEEVYEGLTGGWFSEEEQAAWSANERAWRNRIVDFLKHTNGAFILLENKLADGATESEAPAYLQPDSENSESEREILTSAWCSPRAWDNVARMLSYTGFEKEVTPIQDRILAGAVGRQAAVELATYVHQHTQIDPFSLIKHPEMQEWRVSDAEGATYNDILELARAINEAVPKCDGKDGRPTVVEALDFYEKVLELGGGAHFMTTFCQSKEIGGHYFKNIPIPEGYDRKTWTARINGILKAYRNANLIPDNARSTTTVGQ